MLGLTKREVDAAVRRDRRVRRPEGLHRRPGEDLLVGHVHAPRVRRGHQRGPGRAAGGRGAGRRRRGVHAQVPRQVRRVPAARQDDPARHPLAEPGRAVLRRGALARCRHGARRGRPAARRVGLPRATSRRPRNDSSSRTTPGPARPRSRRPAAAAASDPKRPLPPTRSAAEAPADMFKATEGRWGSREVEITNVTLVGAGRRAAAHLPVGRAGGRPLHGPRPRSRRTTSCSASACSTWTASAATAPTPTSRSWSRTSWRRGRSDAAHRPPGPRRGHLQARRRRPPRSTARPTTTTGCSTASASSRAPRTSASTARRTSGFSPATSASSRQRAALRLARRAAPGSLRVASRGSGRPKALRRRRSRCGSCRGRTLPQLGRAPAGGRPARGLHQRRLRPAAPRPRPLPGGGAGAGRRAGRRRELGPLGAGDQGPRTADRPPNWSAPRSSQRWPRSTPS